MIIFVLLLAMIIISNMEILQAGNFNKEYTSIAQTNIVKGIFVILVLLGHSMQYVKVGRPLDVPYLHMKSHIGQMVVSVFLFYSGFGMMKSIMKKRFQYVRNIPVKRFLITFLNFAVAILLFLVMNICLGIKYDVKTILLSFTGWVSVGNSNWYMFAIFVIYILIFISFFILKWNEKDISLYVGSVLFTILSIAFVYWEMKMKMPNWYYNTVILFALGVWFALLQEKIEAVVMKNEIVYLVICSITAVLYWISYKNRATGGIEIYSVWAILFVCIVILITMKAKINSVVLQWFGKHVFSIYILQRIPMTIISRTGIAAGSPYAFIVLTLVTTAGMAVVFDYFVAKMNGVILGKLMKNK